MGLWVLNMSKQQYTTIRIILVIYCLASYKILHVIISVSFLLFYFILLFFLLEVYCFNLLIPDIFENAFEFCEACA